MYAEIPNRDDDPPLNLMFVRVRVSPSNAVAVREAVARWTACDVPVVLTFMRYYDVEVPAVRHWSFTGPTHTFKKHILNSYWCPRPEFMRAVMAEFVENRLVTMCGTLESGYCRDCRNCETYYWQAKKRMRGEW